MYDGNGKDDNDDANLIERCHAGDRAALEQVCRMCTWPIIRFFHNKARPEDVADLCQETMARLLEKVCVLDPGRPVLPYAFGIARNVLRMYLRKRTRRECDIESVPLAETVPSAGSMICGAQEQRLLLQALREIPLKHQILFELRYFEGISIEVIARQYFRKPSTTVRNWVQQARKLIRQKLETYEASPELVKSTLTHFDDWVAGIRKHVAELQQRQDEQD